MPKTKDEIKEYQRIYRQSPKGKKINRISTWKANGVLCEDFDKLYDYYLSVKCCEICDIELCEGKVKRNRKCLDHNHETGQFRYVLCNTCNYERWA
tara:strand:+ start:958 stop:1245 length:288 start_codon:yes stop_codon:yes gene_type:complete